MACDRASFEAMGGEWSALPVPESLCVGEQAAPSGMSKGRWLLRDRQEGAEDPADPGAAGSRGSFNYSILVYDEEAEKLYYYALDT